MNFSQNKSRDPHLDVILVENRFVDYMGWVFDAVFT